MRQFYCQCGQPVFFDSEYCLACGSRLGFDPLSGTMLSLTPDNGSWRGTYGASYRLCANGTDHGVCNWVVPVTDSHPLCRGCRFNRTVPNQSLPGNQERWRRLEEGKKRLLYTLMQLGIPLENGWDYPRKGLLFDFVEDERSTTAFPETFVHTGYRAGIITINTLEADDAEREMQRLSMNENYRTVLGHLRHESGHYYWQRANPDPAVCEQFTQVFGDESQDYQAALDRYYDNGPREGWRQHFISAYASAHPSEDWAESWGHYLHIYDALETAAAHGLTDAWPGELDISERIVLWRGLSVSLNELNRSVGKRDAYPFVLNEEVEKKMVFVESVIARLRTHAPARAGY
ncbi:MAG: zinc-binding metallopeptidase family protein [Halioglobus sp.]